MQKYYTVFAILRVILTCLPQSAYIHPDEYFQSIEVIAEKAFRVQINKPWEFNATFPIRSISPMYFTVGLSYQILKSLNYFVLNFLGATLVTPYFVIVFPRLMMCLLSFIVDWCLYKICLINNEKYESRCLILSISYIMLVYATHTFSNSIELFLFALLLYFVSESLIRSTTNIKKSQYIDYRYKKAVGPVEKAKFRKLQLCVENDVLNNWFVISTITVVGVFNRPTFIVFAAGPVFFWLYRGIGFRSISSLSFYLRACLFQIGLIPSIILFVLIDSFYFGYLTWGEIGVMKISLDNFVVTPWNFVKYNLDSSNLAQHGLHPRYLHAVVNLPLLFGVLTLFCYSNIIEIIKHIIQTKYHYLPSLRSIKGLMICSFLIPLVTLSYIPHQEPRFLIPLVLPLIYLYGTKILPEADTVVIKISNVKKRATGKKINLQSNHLYKAWILINIGLTIFYGFLHQAGIYSFISHMHTEIKATQYEYHIITSHIYSIPESLFLQSAENFVFNKRYDSAKRIIIHEQGSKDLEEQLSFIERMFLYCKHRGAPQCKISLLFPSTLLENVEKLYDKFNLVISSIVYFYPHISTEALPSISCLDVQKCLSFVDSDCSKYFNLFSLARIEFNLEENKPLTVTTL